jgi:hypothetical protein
MSDGNDDRPTGPTLLDPDFTLLGALASPPRDLSPHADCKLCCGTGCVVDPSLIATAKIESDVLTQCPGEQVTHADVSAPDESTGDGTPGAADRAPDNSEPRILVTSAVPPPKRYAHHGKRRRSYTEEMFRCQHVDKISRSDLVCNALLWKDRPRVLREHLLAHLTLDQVGKMTDDEVTRWYVEAKRIFLQGVPEDCDDEEDDEGDDNGE